MTEQIPPSQSNDPAHDPAHDPPAERVTSIAEFLSASRPMVIAHRGFSGRAPENTLAALERAIEVGADMVEVDVLLSRDGELVVFHDETLERTSDGRGPVADRDLAELRQLDAGSWFDEAFAGEGIPTLDEVLAATDGRILLNVEIKSEAVTERAEGGIAEKVADALRRRGMVDRVVVSSFDPRALAHLRDLAPEIHTASLFDPQVQSGRTPREITSDVGSQSFSVGSRNLTDAMLRDAADHDLRVAVYTVNAAREMERLLDRGVHAFFTDRPDVMIRLLAENPGRWARSAD